jgi:hypothetical protein
VLLVTHGGADGVNAAIKAAATAARMLPPTLALALRPRRRGGGRSGEGGDGEGANAAAATQLSSSYVFEVGVLHLIVDEYNNNNNTPPWVLPVGRKQRPAPLSQVLLSRRAAALRRAAGDGKGAPVLRAAGALSVTAAVEAVCLAREELAAQREERRRRRQWQRRRRRRAGGGDEEEGDDDGDDGSARGVDEDKGTDNKDFADLAIVAAWEEEEEVEEEKQQEQEQEERGQLRRRQRLRLGVVAALAAPPVVERATVGGRLPS